MPRPVLQQAVGYEVLLQCMVDSFPNPAIDWSRAGEVLSSEGRFTVTHFSPGARQTRTALKVEIAKIIWRV